MKIYSLVEEQWNIVWIINELEVENKLLLRLIAQAIPIMQGLVIPSKDQSEIFLPLTILFLILTLLITASQVNSPAQREWRLTENQNKASLEGTPQKEGIISVFLLGHNFWS